MKHPGKDSRNIAFAAVAALIAALSSSPLEAHPPASFDESFYRGGLEYRLVGPFRGGRSAAVLVVGQPQLVVGIGMIRLELDAFYKGLDGELDQRPSPIIQGLEMPRLSGNHPVECLFRPVELARPVLLDSLKKKIFRAGDRLGLDYSRAETAGDARRGG